MDITDEDAITPEEKAQAERGALLVAAAVRQTQAPHSLREAIERDRAQAATRPPRRHLLRRFVLGPAGAGVIVAGAIGFFFLAESISEHSDEGGGATVAQVASIGATLPATSGAPASDGKRLNVSVEGVAFPDWTYVNWPPTGRRADTVGGRRVATVYYEAKGVTVSYSIVGGDQLDWPPGRDVQRGGDTYRVTHAGGRTLVTWTQQGHTCVVTSPSTLRDDKLVQLAAAEPA